MTGPQEFRLTSGPDGAFSQERVPPGPYVLRVEAEGYMMKQKTIEPAANDRLVADVDLRRRPRQALVVLRRDRIEIRRQVHFQTNSAEILPDSNALLEEVVDTILRNPQVRHVDVQGHTDDVGGREYNQGLSQRRAESVRAFLIQNGVPAEKLESHGHGMDRPLVPNITAGNRARNRRVEFHITDQGTPETRTVPVPGGPGASGAAP
jgi:outer membrane protein OmpA-like peptidoglycan-associated protein